MRIPEFLRVRAPVCAGLLVIAASLLIAVHVKGSLPAGWSMLKVVVLTHPSLPFEDIQSVTYSIECVKAGTDPYETRCDPWNRPLNYPSIWLELGRLGISANETTVLGAIFACMTATALLILLRAKRLISAAIVFFAVTSRPVLLLLERGNTDQVIFFLLVVGLYLIDRLRPDWAKAATVFLLVSLTALKLYPVAAVAMLVNSRRSVYLALVTAVLALTALVATSPHHLVEALTGTPQMYMASFGSYSFFHMASLGHWNPAPVAYEAHHLTASVAALVVFSVACLAGFLNRDRFAGSLPQISLETMRGKLAVASLCIFCFAFLAGSSFNYRLIFLIGVLSYLVVDLDGKSPARYSLLAALTITAFLCFPGKLLMIHEVLDGLVFVGLSVWFGATLAEQLGVHHEPQRVLIPAPAV